MYPSYNARAGCSFAPVKANSGNGGPKASDRYAVVGFLRLAPFGCPSELPGDRQSKQPARDRTARETLDTAA